MPEQTPIRTGRFVWHDMMTTDMDRSIPFYTKLLGWRTENVPVTEEWNYTMIRAADTAIGGFVPLDPGEGIPSHWLGYVTVEDVDAAVERARSLGGKVPVRGTDIPNVGRFAVVSHPGGSFISPFAPHDRDEVLPEAEPVAGRFCWNQLMTRSPQEAGSFYGRVFGWTLKEQHAGESRYWLFQREGVDAAGMMTTPDPGHHPDFWLPYVEVDDVDACAARARELGGQLLAGPSDIPGLARFAVTADPTGAILAISTHR